MKIVVVGAGAAGMMAAGIAARELKDNGISGEVLLLERNAACGKKILITGKGRCNMTNSTDIKGIMANIPGNSSFLYSSLNNFSAEDIIEFFESIGVKTKVERGNRVFPVSDRAKDVADALIRFCTSNGVIIKCNSRVKSADISDGRISSVTVDIAGVENRFDCDKLIIATGGKSYPRTGSTGDGYNIAKNLGHTIITPKPSLIPLLTDDSHITDLQGLSLKNIKVTFYDKFDKKIYDDFGELLFTHFGLSGPVILSASRHLLDYDYKNIVCLIDLKPALSEEQLDKRLLRDFETYSGKMFKNSLKDLFPQKLIPLMIELSKIDPEINVAQIEREQRKWFVQVIKNIKVPIVGSGKIEEAVITVGGVDTKEINPKTMESKLIKGLFFAGEVIDVDGYTGGYNLTIAFSTGYAAGKMF
jgi:predicted Rossmann fold flavoprotein